MGANIKKAITATTYTEVTDAHITFDAANACPTATPQVATISYAIALKSTDKKHTDSVLKKLKLAADGGTFVIGASATTDPSFWKNLDGAGVASKGDFKAGGLAVPSAGKAASTTQSAAKTVSATVELTTSDYADCNKLK